MSGLAAPLIAGALAGIAVTETHGAAWSVETFTDMATACKNIMGLLLLHRAQLPLEDDGDVVDHAEYCRNRGYRSRGSCGCDAYGTGLSGLAR